MYYANVQYFKNRAAREKLAKIKKNSIKGQFSVWCILAFYFSFMITKLVIANGFVTTVTVNELHSEDAA